jgi:hypothetical protein
MMIKNEHKENFLKDIKEIYKKTFNDIRAVLLVSGIFSLFKLLFYLPSAIFQRVAINKSKKLSAKEIREFII